MRDRIFTHISRRWRFTTMSNTMNFLANDSASDVGKTSKCISLLNWISPLHDLGRMIKIEFLKNFAPSSILGSIALFFSMLMVAASPLKGAIVANGDYEQNTLAGAVATAPLTSWAPTNSAGGITQVFGLDTTQTYGTAPHGGSISVAFTSDASAPANTTASISQTLTTDSTKTYNLQLWVANPVADVNSRQNLFSVIWNGAAVNLSSVDPVHFAVPNPANPNATELAGAAGTYVVTGDTTWFVVNILNLVPGAGSTTPLRFEGQNNNYATLVDDVSVVETPEPSTMVLLVAGVALIGSRRRRQQAKS